MLFTGIHFFPLVQDDEPPLGLTARSVGP